MQTYVKSTRMHTLMHAYIPTYLHIYLHTNTTVSLQHQSTCISICIMCTIVCVYAYTTTLMFCLSIHAQTCTTVKIQTHIYTGIYVHIYIRIHMYSCIGVFMWYRDIHMQTCIASDCESGLWCCPAAQLHRGSAPASDKFRVLRLSFFSFWVLVCNYRF